MNNSVFRRISQVLFFLVFVYIFWSTTYPLRGLIPAEVIFKSDPLLILVTSLSERIFLAGLISSLVMLLLAFVFGRLFCGWACPLGSLIDAAGAFRRRRGPGSPYWPKFLLLALIGLLAAAGVQAAWLFDPIVIAARFVSLNLIPAIIVSVDGAFVFLIRSFGLYGGVYDFYRQLKSSVLGIDPRFFSHSLVILASFAAIMAWAFFVLRGWCRSACPLGALYALMARFSLIRREVAPCRHCGACARVCPTGAINADLSYHKGECIMCGECVIRCPDAATHFVFGARRPAPREEGAGITRRQFLSFFLLTAAGSVVPPFPVAPRKRKQRVLRPPAALEEDAFVNRCVRCGNCMKVCITNGLQPALLQVGPGAVWTPHLVPEIGYCEYNCTLCGSVCPTGAIPKLTVPEKKAARIGIAVIDHKICLPWKENKECLVCEEHCPVARKAIILREHTENGKTVKRPKVVPHLCIGCGICQTRCPTKPVRAVRVFPVRVTHGVTKP